MGIIAPQAKPHPAECYAEAYRPAVLLRALLTCALAGGAGMSPVAAQQGVIVYDHAPALPAFPQPKSPRFIYPKSTAESPGVPYLIEIPKGGELCLRVENVNWLLYRYDVKVDTVKAPDIAGIGDVLGALTAVVDARMKTATIGTNYELYLASVTGTGAGVSFPLMRRI